MGRYWKSEGAGAGAAFLVATDRMRSMMLRPARTFGALWGKARTWAGFCQKVTRDFCPGRRSTRCAAGYRPKTFYLRRRAKRTLANRTHPLRKTGPFVGRPNDLQSVRTLERDRIPGAKE